MGRNIGLSVLVVAFIVALHQIAVRIFGLGFLEPILGFVAFAWTVLLLLRVWGVIKWRW